MNTELDYKYNIGDTVIFRYQKNEDSEGVGKIEYREIGPMYTIRINEHPRFRKGSIIKFNANEIVSKINVD